ncbi:MAG: 3-oxoacyl-ACP reductase FabG [Victivallales bacterium]|nr:3-oxoacyl-ACP reductase FabG [Victivallales bacterium]MBR6059960.1 3-oxoacyl-ACP reductase FabG [Victivallales bacterium]
MLTYHFENRTAIVTGGSRGIGAATVKAFLQAGATVVAVYSSNDEAANAFKVSLGELAANLTLAKLDVADYAQAEDFFRQFDESHPTLDILVNSAGIRRDGVAAMMSEESWRAVIDVNLTGAFNMSKLAIQRMMGKRYGRIVHVTSPSGRMGIEGQSNYAASKAGLVALAKSISKETARRNITVNCVSPGFIDTDFISNLPPEQLDAYRKSVPMKRLGKPEEVAQAILFLASEESAYITGSVLEITGGLA